MPYFGVAYEQLRALPSLKNEKDKIDQLCYLFLQKQKMTNGFICPMEKEEEVDDFYLEAEAIKGSLLAKCSTEDAVEFVRIMFETKVKYEAHMLNSNDATAVLPAL